MPGSCQNHLTRQLGPSVRICQINVESISWSKCQYLSRMLKEQEIDVAAIQETRISDQQDFKKRGKIPGYDLVGATLHHAHGTATYVRSNIENASLISTSTDENIHTVIVKIGGVTVTNVYKPPAVPWPAHVLQTHAHPSIYIGDFNSHHESWKYRTNDPNGESLADWAEHQNLQLVFDAKDRGTFKSAAWGQEYNPDLCFVSKGTHNEPLMTRRRVLEDFPHSQHRPVVAEVGMHIPLVSSFPRPRWNFAKANWNAFTNDLDKCLGWIPPTAKNYSRFVGAVTSTAKKHIPRGFRKEYIPGWEERSETLYQEFLDSGDQEIADELLHSLDAARRHKWTETVESTDFKHSSRKAWNLLRKLGDASSTIRQETKVTPNQIAARIVSLSRATRNKTHDTQVKEDLKNLKETSDQESIYSLPFCVREVAEALKDLTPGKAPGFDGIHSEFLRHCGKYARIWLSKFFSDILQTGYLPSTFKRSKIIALLKPGKPSELPESYRPIALLSICLKLLERLLLNRIGPIILEHIPIEQAGFRPNRSTTDQILSLTTYIEAGFQQRLKTSVAFIDLTAAYDTVWREGLIYKLLKATRCIKTTALINNMLSNRTFQVIMGTKISGPKLLNNGLPQGSVLAPLLFSLYIADMPDTISRKFGYADDWALATSSTAIETTETILSSDLDSISKYFQNWRLQPSTSKTEVCCFHLNNKLASRELEIYLNGRVLRHNRAPKYLGITLDRSLTFKRHLTNTSAKIKTRNNIMQKLTGTSWGASAATLRSSAIGLVYSAAEYGAPVWINSAHTHLVDRQLNNTMRLISGTIRSTPIQWLPVLSHIPPPPLRRSNALCREFRKIMGNPQLPLHQDVPNLINRLKSRHPPVSTAMGLSENNFDVTQEWRREWELFAGPEQQGLPCIENQPPGHDLPRRTWTALNRLRTNHGRCADFLYKCQKIPSPQCDCGHERQTIRHLREECPLRAYEGGQQDFLTPTPAVIDWINNLDINL